MMLLQKPTFIAPACVPVAVKIFLFVHKIKDCLITEHTDVISLLAFK